MPLFQTDAERMAYWQEYYRGVNSAANPDSSDYPTTRMHVESLASTLKMCGEVAGAEVLDAGAGSGQLAAMFGLFGAKRVEAFDFDKNIVKWATKRWEGHQVTWSVGDLLDDATWPEGTFDLVTCVEAMHVVPVGDAIRRLWNRVRPGGRLVSVFTNADSPINDIAMWRNGGVAYYGIGQAGLNPMLRNLGGVATYRIAGLHFGDDQRVEVYDSTRLYATAPAPYSWLLCAVKVSG